MRTTITLDDETPRVAAYYARARGITLSAAINELVRKAETAPPTPMPEIGSFTKRFAPVSSELGRTSHREMVKKLEEEEFDPEKFA